MDNASKRANNFGLLRLGFAALVVVSHAPTLLDGGRDQEPLFKLFGTLTFGEVAVDGFFIISGFLISQSFARTQSLPAYLIKRGGRILPGFLVASALCYFALAPQVGATQAVLSPGGVMQFLSQALRLLPPYVPGTFGSLMFPSLNGSMWTIAYEARCYLAVAVIGLLFRRTPLTVATLAGFVLLLLAIAAAHTLDGWHLPDGLERLLGNPFLNLRLIGVFGVGALFYLLRSRLPLRRSIALGAATLLTISLFVTSLAEPVYALCGGYLIFFVAFRMPPSRLSRFTDRTDLSYGLYLYAWPVSQVLILVRPDISAWTLSIATLLIAVTGAAASWFLVEKPAMVVAHRWAARLAARPSLSEPAPAAAA